MDEVEGVTSAKVDADSDAVAVSVLGTVSIVVGCGTCREGVLDDRAGGSCASACKVSALVLSPSVGVRSNALASMQRRKESLVKRIMSSVFALYVLPLAYGFLVGVMSKRR